MAALQNLVELEKVQEKKTSKWYDDTNKMNSNLHPQRGGEGKPI